MDFKTHAICSILINPKANEKKRESVHFSVTIK